MNYKKKYLKYKLKYLTAKKLFGGMEEVGEPMIETPPKNQAPAAAPAPAPAAKKKKIKAPKLPIKKKSADIKITKQNTKAQKKAQAKKTFNEEIDAVAKAAAQEHVSAVEESEEAIPKESPRRNAVVEMSQPGTPTNWVVLTPPQRQRKKN